MPKVSEKPLMLKFWQRWCGVDVEGVDKALRAKVLIEAMLVQQPKMSVKFLLPKDGEVM
jgi:hypothetical protein